MIKKAGFDMLIASHPDYEQLVCEIYYDGLYFGQISEEKGKGVFCFETPGPDLDQTKVIRRVDLEGLQDFMDKCVAVFKDRII